MDNFAITLMKSGPQNEVRGILWLNPFAEAVSIELSELLAKLIYRHSSQNLFTLSLDIMGEGIWGLKPIPTRELCGC